MKSTPNLLGDMPMGRLIAKMSIPLMISMLIQSLYNIVDSFFVAKLGMEAIPAIGISFPVQMLMISLANGIGVGMNSVISQRFGRGEGKRAGKAAGNAILLCACLMILFMAFGWLGCDAFFRASTKNPLIHRYGVQYLQIVTLGSVGIFSAVLGGRLLQVTGKTNLSMLTQISGAVVNLVMDPILIFGLFGFPELGIRGAAVATVAGQLVSGIIGCTLHLKVNHALRWKASDFRLDGDALLICKIGLPASITMAMSSVSTFGMNQILESSVVAMSVFTVCFRLQSILFMPAQGLMQGLIPIVGYNYGAKNGHRIRHAIAIAVKTELVMMTIGLLICELAPVPVFSLFTSESDPEMLRMGVDALRIIGWTFPLAGAALVLSNVFQGMGNGIPSMIYGMSRQCVVLLPTAFLLVQTLGVGSVWYAVWVSECVTVGIVVWAYRREYRKRVVPLFDLPSEGTVEV